ncbi:MAG TPA: tetratricopeptide repeat protein [Luteibaculaceae bacterium]|nr:tetratricopeptide repeat protein [Luteibaculaceae bacterium]
MMGQDTLVPGNNKAIPEERDKMESVAQFFEGLRQKNLNQVKAASEAFKKCLKLDPANDAAWYELAQLSTANKDFQGALSEIEQARKLSPDNIYYLEFQSQILIELGNAKEALKTFGLLQKKMPTNPDYLLAMGSIYESMKKTQQADEYYAKAQALSDNPFEILDLRVRNYINAQRPKDALRIVEALTADFPDPLFVQNFRAELMLLSNRVDDAINLWDSLASPPNNYPPAALRLARVKLEQGKIDESTQLAGIAAKDPEVNIDAKMELILGYLNVYNKYPSIRQNLDSITWYMTVAHPGDPKSFAAHGDALNNANKKREAISAYLEAVKLAPSNHQIWQEIIALEFQLELNDSLSKHTEYTTELFPNLPLFHYFKATFLYQDKKYDAAISAYESALGLIVDNPNLKQQVYSGLGDAYHYSKQYSKSDQAFEKALAIDPSDSYALNNYSYFLSLRKSNLEKAKQMSSKTLSMYPENPSYLDTYGWILFQMGDYVEAKKILEKALSLSTDNAELFEHFGDILFKLGDTDQAVFYWSKALSLGSTTPDLKKKIDLKTITP